MKIKTIPNGIVWHPPHFCPVQFLLPPLHMAMSDNAQVAFSSFLLTGTAFYVPHLTGEFFEPLVPNLSVSWNSSSRNSGCETSGLVA